MALFLDDRKRSGEKFAGYLALLFFFFLALHYPEWSLRIANWRTTTVPSPDSYQKKEIIVVKNETENAGLKGRMFQHFFSQRAHTAGKSPDELSIGFDQPVVIKGILFSVDCWKSTRLVEFAAGLNQQPAYQAGTEANMLFHVSFATNLTAGKIDEHTWFPEPIAMSPQDRLNIGAWIQNVSGKTQSVSPEIIVYYSWASSSEMPKPREDYPFRSHGK